ncbi:hypothetical protein [uncultured Bacteroides sp.]|uniref:hypothetical protein n=1 Tax=uncultured Bacteroides sp. TaxID=162156 RepID=UPI00280BC2DD|nr:hypothetical protein [uncultured Bacteroides sp.]
MNVIKYCFCMLVWIACPMYAQNVNENARQVEQDDPYKENFRLRSENGNLQSRLEELNRKVQELNEELEKQKKMLEEEKANVKVRNLKDENRSLGEIIEILKGDTTRLAEQLRQQANDFRERSEADRREKEELQRGLDELRSFRIKWLSQLAEEVDGKWLKKSYSEISVAELQKELTEYKKYAKEDEKVAKACDQLEKLLAECQLYEDGVNVIHAPYDEMQVNRLKSQIQILKEQVDNEFKKKELERLYTQLNNYRVTIEIFQDVIKAVEESIIGQDAHDIAWPLVEVILKRQEDENGYISALRDIPWLSEQFDLYYAALKADCLSKSAVRNKIMSYFQK